MKKLFQIAAAFLVAMALIAGCSRNKRPQSQILTSPPKYKHTPRVTTRKPIISKKVGNTRKPVIKPEDLPPSEEPENSKEPEE